jgi:hypothetical protein
MSLKFAKSKVAASAVRKDKKREIPEALVVDAETGARATTSCMAMAARLASAMAKI